MHGGGYITGFYAGDDRHTQKPASKYGAQEGTRTPTTYVATTSR